MTRRRLGAGRADRGGRPAPPVQRPPRRRQRRIPLRAGPLAAGGKRLARRRDRAGRDPKSEPAAASRRGYHRRQAAVRPGGGGRAGAARIVWRGDRRGRQRGPCGRRGVVASRARSRAHGEEERWVGIEPVDGGPSMRRGLAVGCGRGQRAVARRLALGGGGRGVEDAGRLGCWVASEDLVGR